MSAHYVIEEICVNITLYEQVFLKMCTNSGSSQGVEV